MVRTPPRHTVRAEPAPTPLDVRLMQSATLVLLLVLAALCAGAVLRWVMETPRFTLAGIRIEGDVTHSSEVTLRANAIPHLAGNLFSLDLTRAREAFEAVPWVRRAVVQRVWPNRLAVRLEEHRAAAWWHVEEREDKLVNRQGEVFEVNLGDVEDENLPLLTGPEGTSAAMLAMHGRLQPVFERLGVRLGALHLSSRGSWRAVLDSGAELELGRGIEDEVVARTQVFTATVRQVTARYQRPLEYADLRHADGYALRLRGIGTVAPVAAATRR